MRRKPNSEQRRRDLCDAAIQLLATEGARGLTQLRVDRHAGFADGTTSFYYQTRSALLRGTIDRVIELDVADFTEALDATRVGEIDSLLSHLAEHAMRTAVEPERSRARQVRADDDRLARSRAERGVRKPRGSLRGDQ
jgi:DNA-binding transcriptional regulator YbjK